MKGSFREVYVGLREQEEMLKIHSARGLAIAESLCPAFRWPKSPHSQRGGEHSRTEKGRKRIGGGLCCKQENNLACKSCETVTVVQCL